jgi:hypothetical protein
VLGGIHGDEGPQHVLDGLDALARPGAEGDAPGRGELLPVPVDGPNVVVLGDRPVAARGLDLVQVHRVLRPQAGEVVLPPVLAEQVGVGRVDLVQREAGGIADALAELGQFHVRHVVGGVEQVAHLVEGVGHGSSPRE